MPFRALTPCICCVSVTSVTGDGGESICYLPIIGLNCNSDANSYRKLAGVSFVICTKFLSTDCAILRLCSLFRNNYTTVTWSICHRRMIVLWTAALFEQSCLHQWCHCHDTDPESEQISGRLSQWRSHNRLQMFQTPIRHILSTLRSCSFN